jgi:filamentous hemagglutinin family protein
MLRVSKLALVVSLAFNGAAQAALPTGAQVASGSVQIGTVGKTMSITNSPSAIINWQSFSIGQSHAVKFVQQSASSSVLNRVVGGQMSAIMGRLTSNGQVFLINPAGVLVGAGAVIDTASFFASTLKILDQDFLAGKLQFQGDADSGKITNQGWIRTGYGGQVVLIAPNIENSGIIQAPGGKILLAAGQKVTLGTLDMDGLGFQVQAPTDSALNLGQLIADGGVVQVFAGSLKHSGDIRANSLTRDSGGEIVLKARGDVELAAGSTTVASGRTGGTIRIESETGAARVAGDVSATGRTGAGGAIDVLGEKVVLTGNATLDASGATSGGVIRAGGDWQGANPDVKNAQTAFVGAGVTLKADATDQGDGGKIVVWSDGDTRFLGSLSAQGGPNGGNGGNAEVSGKGDLLFIGGANLGAPKGTAGSLLLDPLDLFVDAVGGLNPSIIDETTDYPDHAATVAPATLAAIVGNVTLYASRDMRLNSLITLAGAGQGLAANAGRDLQIGAGITTNGGAVSLVAARNMSTFGSSPIATSGGNVTLSAQSISNVSMTVAAGTGTVNAQPSAGALTLGTILSSGSAALTSTGGGLSLSNIASTGPVSLGGSTFVSTGAISATTGAVTVNSGGSSLSTGVIDTTGGPVVLNSATSISTSNISTGGGTLSATASGSSLNTGSIDTRPGGAGPTGAAVTLVSTPSSVSTGNISTGNANVNSTAGTSVSGSTITTTGNVVLTANAGNISYTINDAANVTATSNRSISNTSISLSSTSTTTPLNATSITATAVNCNSTNSCPSATINLSSTTMGVNVGTVTANAPATTYFVNTPQYQSRSRSVTVNGGNGPILAMSSASQITATDVTLQTNQAASHPASNAGIGSLATPLKVDVERSFTFRPNGEFGITLNGSGPVNLVVQPGVAAVGTYSGSLTKSGQIALNVGADTTAVTASNFSITGGFDAPVYGQTPQVSLSVPNGNLIATSVSAPKGDQAGFASCTYYYCGTSIIGLPVTLQASNNLDVGSFMREAGGAYGKNTTFTATNGLATIGTVVGSRDSFTMSGSMGVAVSNLTTLGIATASSSAGNITVTSLGAASGVTLTSSTGNITIDSVSSSSGSVGMTANNGSIGATSDGSAVEVTAANSINLSANKIGTSGFGNPLELAGGSISLTTTGSGTYIGSDASLTANPVTAVTSNLTINAAGNFKVDTTTAIDLVNLSVTASPSGVGNGGMARVTSTSTIYDFLSDGANFTVGGTNIAGGAALPGNQLSGGGLSFTSTSGNLTLDSMNFSASGANLTVRTNEFGSGNVIQTPASTIDLGTGTFTIVADGNVTLESVNAGGLNAMNANSGYFADGCLGYYDGCGVASFTANQPLTDAANGGGVWSVTSRGAITTGSLAVGGVDFQTYAGNIATGTIDASSVNLSAGVAYYYSYANTPAVSVTTGAIGLVNRPDTVTIAAGNNGYYYYHPVPGSVQTGAIEGGTVSITSHGGDITISGKVGDNTLAHTPAGSVSLSADRADYGYAGIPGVLQVGAITSSNDITLYNYYPGAITSGALTAASAIDIRANGGAVSTGALDAGGNIAITSDYYAARPSSVTVGGAIGAITPNTSVAIETTGALSIGGAVTLDAAQAGSVGLTGNTVSLAGGVITGGDGTGVTIQASNTLVATPFQFTIIDTGATGTVSITAPAGILQSAVTGITAKTVSLSSTSAGSAIEGTSRLDLFGTTDLTLNVGGSLDLDLNSSTLASLNVTKSDNAAAFSLNGTLGSGQSVTIVDNLGVGVGVAVGSPLGGLNFTLNNTAGDVNSTGIATNGGNLNITSGGAFTNTGITTNGGAVDITAYGPFSSSSIATLGGYVNIVTVPSFGTVSTGAISTDPGAGGGGPITVTTNGLSSDIYQSGNLTTGSGGDAIGLRVNGSGSITRSGNFTITSDSQVFAETANGDVGASGTALQITSPAATLRANFPTGVPGVGNVYAAMTGTTDLTLTADNDFSVATSATLDSLSLTTRGTGTGTMLSLGASGQTFSFARPVADPLDSRVLTNTFRVVGAGGATTLANGSFSASDGDLLVAGTSPFNVTNLSLSANTGDLRLEGTTGSPLAIIDSTTQFFNAGQRLFVGHETSALGKVSLTASGSQTLQSAGDFLVDAHGGNVVISGGSQTLTSTGTSTMTLRGGPGTGESVSVTNSAGAQLLSAGTASYTTGNIVLTGGVGDGSTVTVTNNGSGGQSFTAGTYYGSGTLALTGGSGDASSISVVNNGNGNQTFSMGYYSGSITFKGGTGSTSFVNVSSSGSGTQDLFAKGNITFTGGDGPGTGSYVALTKSGSNGQYLNPTGAIAFNGGIGDGNFVRVENTGAGKQIIGYSCSYYYYCGDYYQFHNPGNVTASVTLQGGAGDGSYALVQAVGEQWITPTGSVSVLGGGGDGSHALVNGMQTGNSGRNQLIGHPNSTFYYESPLAPYLTDYESYYHTTPSAITVTAGAGLNAFASVTATGQQSMYSTSTITIGQPVVSPGSTGDGAYASLTGAGQDIRSGGAMRVVAGTGDGADALIVSSGGNVQFLRSGSLTVAAGGTAGVNTAVARIVAGAAQQFGDSSEGTTVGTTTITAGIGPDSVAEVVAPGSQNLRFGSLSLSAVGAGQNARARIEAGTSQNLSSSNVSLIAGSAAGASALIKAATGQTLTGSGGVTLTGGTGTAGTGNDASALIVNLAGAQAVSKGSGGIWTLTSGADYGPAGILNNGTTQDVVAGNISILTGAGANNVNVPLFGNYAAGIVSLGSGTQTVTGGAITISNSSAPGSTGIYSGNSQTIAASGVVTVQVTAGAGTAAIDAVSGTQTIRGTLASTADPGSANAGQVANAGSANGGVRVQVTGGSGGTARIANSGGGQNIIGSFVDVNTGASGTAAVTASGDQWIHTTNGVASGVGSLRVAAVGGGSATVSSGGYQLLQIDYPELMQGARNGSITVGGAGVTGSSLISAVDQDVFARSITVLGGATVGANAKIDVSGIQNVSLVSSTATPTAGITVTGGAGGTALIDPVTQTILSNGAISVTGGSGTGTIGGIIGTGDQTILVTSGGANSILVQGGPSGSNGAFGQITTTGAIQRIGTSGDFVLIGGLGNNADAIIGANGGTAETFLACGSGFTCNAGLAPFTAISSVNNPFVDPTTQVGVYYSPITVPLDDIFAATGGGVPGAVPQESSTLALPDFLFNSLLLWDPELSLTEDERQEILLGRRLPVCN